MKTRRSSMTGETTRSGLATRTHTPALPTPGATAEDGPPPGVGSYRTCRCVFCRLTLHAMDVEVPR
jgi:hypothetical protein